MNISLNKAEEIAKLKLKEYFSQRRYNVTPEIAARLGLSAMRFGAGWVVHIDVYPGPIKPLDPKSKALLDDSPETRAKIWISVFVDGESGDARIREECDLASLLKTVPGSNHSGVDS